MQICKMAQAHVGQVAQLETICFSDPWSENSVHSELSNPLSLWLVAVDDETVAGYVGSQSVETEADMMNIAVHPDYRRQGIAKELVTELIRQLRCQGVSSLTLEVRASNMPAIALYEKMGFETVGCRPNYYRHPREDAQIMRKVWQI